MIRKPRLGVFLRLRLIRIRFTGSHSALRAPIRKTNRRLAHLRPSDGRIVARHTSTVKYMSCTRISPRTGSLCNLGSKRNQLSKSLPWTLGALIRIHPRNISRPCPPALSQILIVISPSSLDTSLDIRSLVLIFT
jgi:hypothetical protein